MLSDSYEGENISIVNNKIYIGQLNADSGEYMLPFKSLSFPSKYITLNIDNNNLKIWYKFDDIINLGLNSSLLGNEEQAVNNYYAVNNYDMIPSNISGNPIIDKENYLFGSSSAKFNKINDDVVDSGLYINNFNNLFPTKTIPISISFWIKANPDEDLNYASILYGKTNDVSNQSSIFEIKLQKNNANILQYFFTISDENGNLDPTICTDNINYLNWNHIVWTIEPNLTDLDKLETPVHTWYLYINGILSNTYYNKLYPKIEVEKMSDDQNKS